MKCKNLPKKLEDGAYVINLVEYADVSTHWITLFCKRSKIVYFDSFGVEHVPEEIKKFIGHKNIILNIFRVQSNNSIMCRYFCIGFIDSMLAGEKLTYFNSLFSSKWRYNFELLQRWMNSIPLKLLKQSWLIKQNTWNN